jgi:hypothetical protein
MELFEKIYKVFGQDTPNRILYNATVASPSSTNTLIKKYKTWKQFEKAYNIFCMTKRTKKPVVTKPAKSTMTKVVTK